MGLLSDYLERKTSKLSLPDAKNALTGRDQAIITQCMHEVKKVSIFPPFDEKYKTLVLAMGCFWGAERLMWQIPGVIVTAVGYGGGTTKNPTYEEVCSGATGHSEAVLVVYDPEKVTLDSLVKTFFEGHDPTQGYRQGNDIGTQYRSLIMYDSKEELDIINSIRDSYEQSLQKAGFPSITTEILPRSDFFYAEEYHQQYLVKNPMGYCGIGGTGVACQVGLVPFMKETS
ncbi:MAG: peptide-methionine (S)-S-oxide reductase MsrA [Acidimicrobiales bacterium]|nr:peptide-methionine (S)-S-oxide reductase MsrA [Acidimicrobiales bacterium]